MNGTQGGLTVAISDLYLLKFLLLSMVISHAPNCAIYLWLTCSQVRFNRRIGGVLRPEVMAIMVEKLFSVRQRYGTVSTVPKLYGLVAHISNKNKMFDGRSTLSRVLFRQNHVSDPIGNLLAVREKTVKDTEDKCLHDCWFG